jgi:hypothetical protein
VVIPQPLHDIYLREAFREGLRTKVKMAIISMSRRTLAKVAIMIEEEMLVRRNNIARYHQEFDGE